MRELKKITYTLTAFLVVLFFIFSSLVGGVGSLAYAAITSYSDVLEDLQLDSDFLSDDYAEDNSDYSLYVIQIAESSDGELFIYVHQPYSGTDYDLTATSINISTGIDESLNYYNYNLTLLSSSGVFRKYLVEDFTVKADALRYYDISQIMRAWISGIDEEAGYDNTINEVPCAVAQQWCASTENDEVTYTCIATTTIEVTDKFVGYVRYSNGFYLNQNSACDSHFVAFSTDIDIDYLLEADVYYTYQGYYENTVMLMGTTKTYSDVYENYVYLTSDGDGAHVDYTGSGLFAGTYSWDRIETVEQFKEETNTYQNVYSGVVLSVSVGTALNDEAVEALEGKQWVLRFVETGYSNSYSDGVNTISYVLVGDVMILRLKFVYNGETYNLGVIDNKQTGSIDPVNTTRYDVSLSKNGKMLIFLLLLILLLVLFILFYPILIPVFKGVVTVVSLPFKAIGTVFKGIKNRMNKDKNDGGK